MTTCLGKSCLLSLFFPFGIEGGMWDVIVLIPDYCLSIYLLTAVHPFITLKAPSKNCRGRHFIPFLLSFEENRP